MSDKRFRRLIGGTSAVAVAAGFVVAVGVGSAGAASGTVSWDENDRPISRTISNVTPVVGETITSTSVIRRDWALETFTALKDVHPSCLTYVSGSAKVNGSVVAPESTGSDFVRVTGSWTVKPYIDPKSMSFEVSYVVGASCDRATPLMTTLHTSGSLGNGTYQDKGPTVTVAKNVTTTLLDAVSGAKVGKSTTLTANVSGGSQGDAVDFYDGATKLGSGSLNGSGVATFAWTPSASGTRSVQAKYLGGAKSNASDSSVQSVQVAAADVVTSMTVSAPETAVTGTEVTLSANVTPSTAVGTVQFKDNGANIGAPRPVSNGTATMQHTFQTAGSRNITAQFLPGNGFAGTTSAQQPVAVNDPDVQTTTALQIPETAETGVPVTLTANLTPTNASGTVQFKDGTTNIGDPKAVSGGKAQLSHTFTEPGNHSISAVFTGNPGFLGSTASAKSLIATDPQVPDVQTSTILTVQSDAQTGTAVALSAKVTPANASGTVQFKDGNGNIGDAIQVINGVAATQHRFTSAGTHSITAVFTAGTGFVGSMSEPQSVQVSDPAAGDVSTTTTLTVPGTATVGQNATLSARVTGDGVLTGTVQFYDGSTPIGVGVPVVNGEAVLLHTFTNAGSHGITAVYSGGAGSQASTSSLQTVQVSTSGGDGGGTGSLGSLSGFGS
ncbi:Ig-like domain repeat protein [Rhodococcus hoagii]|nr:Ig-like domain repeat protein [Prescottella equi]